MSSSWGMAFAKALQQMPQMAKLNLERKDREIAEEREQRKALMEKYKLDLQLRDYNRKVAKDDYERAQDDIKNSLAEKKYELESLRTNATLQNADTSAARLAFEKQKQREETIRKTQTNLAMGEIALKFTPAATAPSGTPMNRLDVQSSLAEIAKKYPMADLKGVASYAKTALDIMKPPLRWHDFYKQDPATKEWKFVTKNTEGQEFTLEGNVDPALVPQEQKTLASIKTFTDQYYKRKKEAKERVLSSMAKAISKTNLEMGMRFDATNLTPQQLAEKLSKNENDILSAISEAESKLRGGLSEREYFIKSFMGITKKSQEEVERVYGHHLPYELVDTDSPSFKVDKALGKEGKLGKGQIDLQDFKDKIEQKLRQGVSSRQLLEVMEKDPTLRKIPITQRMQIVTEAAKRIGAR